LAVVGPAGCGKTALLNVLSRRITGPSVSGEQFLAGCPFDDVTLRRLSTFIEHDGMIGSLTVHETLKYTAKLVLPRDINAQERGERVDEMMKTFELTPLKDTKIGRISAGQKKRVVVACQLMALPKIVFMGSKTLPLY